MSSKSASNLGCNLSCPDPGRREKINLHFYFRTFLWCLQRFNEGLKGLYKTFWSTTKKRKNKNLIFVSIEFSEMQGVGRVKLASSLELLSLFFSLKNLGHDEGEGGRGVNFIKQFLEGAEFPQQNFWIFCFYHLLVATRQFSVLNVFNDMSFHRNDLEKTWGMLFGTLYGFLFAIHLNDWGKYCVERYHNG